jgi:hypothetical protein
MNTNYKINLSIINLLIFLVFPFNLAIDSNYKFDLDTFFYVFLIFLLTTIFSIFIFFIFELITKKISFNFFYISNFIKFFLTWIFLTGIFFPVVGQHDAFLNLSSSINLKYVVIAKFFLILIFFLLIEKFKVNKFFYNFIFVYIFINLFFIFLNINYNYLNTVNLNHKINEFGKKNLIVLSFDGISDIKIFNEIQSNDKIKKTLKDFIFYKNVISSAPYTKPSMHAEIFGNMDHYINGKLNFNNILNNNDMDIAVYGTYQFFVNDPKRILKEGTYKEYKDNFKLTNFLRNFFLGSIGRWATNLTVPIVELIFDTNYYEQFIDTITFHDSKIDPLKKIKSPNKIDLFEYDLIFDEMKINKDLDNVIRMYHFSFSHWPVIFDEDCKENKKKIKDTKSQEHETIIIKCISKKITKFIKKLKEKKIYDNSMIIIKSDHGKPNYAERSFNTNWVHLFKEKKFNNYYSEYPYNLKINDSFYWGYGRYKPFIMLKDKNFINDEIIFLDKQVFIHDLSSTYCNYFYKVEDCKIYKANNLVSDDNSFEEHIYDIMLPTKKESFKFNKDRFKIFKISNNQPLLNFLKKKKINLKIINEKSN